MTPVLAASIPDVLVFAVAAVVVIVGALGVVFSRNPVHAALMLVMTLFGVAVLFVEQQAHFLAAVQVIVYAGAIVVLVLFAIMLLGVARGEKGGARAGRSWARRVVAAPAAGRLRHRLSHSLPHHRAGPFAELAPGRAGGRGSG